MGILRLKNAPHTEPGIALGRAALLGREIDCAVVDDDHTISRHHAEITWTGGHWVIKDLNSLNGTTVNGERIGSAPRLLLAGDEIRLGNSGLLWELADALPPAPRAYALDAQARQVIEGSDGLLALPHQEEPDATVMACPPGWLLESKSEQRPVRHGEVVMVVERPFRLELPVIAATAQSTARVGQPTVQSLHLTFHCSLDQEHIAIEAKLDGKAPILLEHRAHHLLLWHLARRRVSDERDGHPASEAGWIDSLRLQDDLKLDQTTINLHVFRARKAFEKLGLLDAGLIIERRSGSGQLRIGTRHLSP